MFSGYLATIPSPLVSHEIFKSLAKPITVFTSHFNDSWLPTSWLIALTIISGKGTTKHNAFYVYIHTYISVNVSSDNTTMTVVLLTYQHLQN